MKVRLLTAFFILAAPLLLVPGNAAAVYVGDSGCLICHVGINIGAYFAPDETSYLMTGHKNMLRKVNTPPSPLTGPDGLAYSTDQAGNTFDWTTNAVNILGYCTKSAFSTQSTCVAGGGIWVAGVKNVFYIFDGWMNDAGATSGSPTSVSVAAPRVIYDSTGQGVVQTYSCARCHSTGFTMDSVLQLAKQPEASFPGISWTATNTSGKVNFDPDGDGPAISGSWFYEGIQCERCHGQGFHPIPKTSTSPVVTRNASATALCVNCHRQEHTNTYAGGGLGSNIVPTPYTDNGTLPASEPAYVLPAIEVGGHGGYAPEFYGHSTGMEFLNSVHARFGGTFQQIADAAEYNSFFQAEGGPAGSGCTACHNLHQSTVSAVNAPQPFKQECPGCHYQGQLPALANIKHPTGTGTPLGDLSDIAGACETCHMPKPNKGEGLRAHIWRINVDGGYSTFPTEAQFNAGQKTALTAPETHTDTTSFAPVAFNEAVWVDLDLACGQCHGGGTDSTANPPKPGVYYFSKDLLATYARNMHNSIPTPRFIWGADAATSYKVNFDAGNTTCPPGVTCNYSWDFGDGSIGTGVKVSHPYASSTPVTVTLKVDTNGTFSTNASTSQTVTPAYVNQPPTAAGLAGATLSNYTVSFTDASTDPVLNSPNGITSVTVNWGDGTGNSQAAGTVFTHTYATASTYKILHTATDAARLSASETRTLAVPQKFGLSGTVSHAAGPFPGVLMILKYNGNTKATKTTAADGTYSFTNVLPGAYVVQPYKSGYTFTPATATVTVGPDAAGVDFTATP
jgi:hypothetical protein